MPRDGESLPQASRSMADITRLFMTGARSAPVRTPPGVAPAESGVQKIIPESRQAFSDQPSLPIELNVFIGSWPQAVIAAAVLADKQPVGVVGLIDDHARVVRVGVENESAASSTAHHAPVEMQLARLLFMSKKTVSRWLIVIHPKDRKEMEQLTPVVERWLVAGGTDNDGLIESYRTLKALYDTGRAQDSSPAITLTFDSVDLAEAQRAYTRLSHVARSFLSQQLKFLFGGTEAGSRPVREIADLSFEPAEKAAVWASLFDFALDLADQASESEENQEDATEQVDDALPAAAETLLNTPLHNLLDPEERAALNADFDQQSPVPASDNSSVVKKQDVSAAYHVELPKDAPAAIPVQQNRAVPRPEIRRESSSENNAPAAPRTVRHVPSSESSLEPPVSSPALLVAPAQAGLTGPSLWSAIEPAVASLAAGHTVLEARPPRQLASLLTLDSLGRLHVWMLADAGDPTGYSRVWQWAADHRQLIALTRRDARLDISADVRLHLVLPQGMTLVHGGQSGFERLRIHAVRFGNQQGVVLVPVEE